MGNPSDLWRKNCRALGFESTTRVLFVNSPFNPMHSSSDKKILLPWQLSSCAHVVDVKIWGGATLAQSARWRAFTLCDARLFWRTWTWRHWFKVIAELFIPLNANEYSPNFLLTEPADMNPALLFAKIFNHQGQKIRSSFNVKFRDKVPNKFPTLCRLELFFTHEGFTLCLVLLSIKDSPRPVSNCISFFSKVIVRKKACIKIRRKTYVNLAEGLAVKNIYAKHIPGLGGAWRWILFRQPWMNLYNN